MATASALANLEQALSTLDATGTLDAATCALIAAGEFEAAVEDASGDRHPDCQVALRDLTVAAAHAYLDAAGGVRPARTTSSLLRFDGFDRPARISVRVSEGFAY